MQVLKSLRLFNSVIGRNQPLLNLCQKQQFHSTNFQLASKEFNEAKERLGTLTEDPGSDVKLKIYALFKQATVGVNKGSKPSMVDFVGRAKWNAWSELGQMSQLEAEKEYINLINQLISAEKASEPATTGQFKQILTTVEYGNIYKIVMNRPTKYNAINVEMYNELIQALTEANENTSVQAIVLTGAGEYYCSGNDLTSFSSPEAMANMKQAAKDGGVLLEKFVNSFINLDKPLIALVNGPAVGISVTVMGLMDLVLASDKATFSAPFTKIAQSPEACSSYTFPKMMGNLKASEFLLFNRKLTAQEAFERNLVTQVIPDGNFQEEAWKQIEVISKLPKESLRESRKLLKTESEKEVLREVNKKECDVLVGRWLSSEFVRVIMEFWGAKHK